MYVCVYNNTRPIAVATRIALLRCSVIEIRCWTRYSCKISRPPWNTKGVQGGDWIIVIIYLLIVKCSTLYKQDLDFKNGKNARKNHGYFLVGVGSLIPRMEMRWTKIGLKREREKKKEKKSSTIGLAFCRYDERRVKFDDRKWLMNIQKPILLSESKLEQFSQFPGWTRSVRRLNSSLLCYYGNGITLIRPGFASVAKDIQITRQF